MKKMSKWGKVKKIKKILAVTSDEPEEPKEEKLYDIQVMPEPKYKQKVVKPVSYFVRQAEFQDSETLGLEEIHPCHETRKNFIPSQPFHKIQGSHVQKAHSDMNTETTVVSNTSMNHTEGGWPEHVKAELSDQRSKFIRQTCKEDMFKWTMSSLIKKTESVLKQNNTMNIEEIYFDEIEDCSETGGTIEVKTLAKFKDFSGSKSPVSCISS